LTWRELHRQIQRSLARAGVDEPSREAHRLLELAGGTLVAVSAPGQRPTPAQYRRLFNLVGRRVRREPFAHLARQVEFYSLPFQSTRDALIPRPETETLVDAALDELDSAETGPVLELGTGSGIIAITLAVHRRLLRVYATDISAAALRLASRNVHHHQVEDRVLLRRGDLCQALESTDPGRFRLIVANPPYVREDEWTSLSPEIRLHEPRMALVGGADGMSAIRRVIHAAQDHLLPGGSLLLEVGYGQAAETSSLCRRAVGTEISVLRDLAGIERVVKVKYAG